MPLRVLYQQGYQTDIPALYRNRGEENKKLKIICAAVHELKTVMTYLETAGSRNNNDILQQLIHALSEKNIEVIREKQRILWYEAWKIVETEIGVEAEWRNTLQGSRVASHTSPDRARVGGPHHCIPEAER